MRIQAQNRYSIILMLALLVFTFFAISNAYAQSDDRSESPYFVVNGDGTDKLPLKHTEANVNISGVIADVHVQQVYVNNGKNPIEATYVFPGSTKAAVYAMQMQIGERRIVAEIKEKVQARLDYETALNEGKTASLLEQQRPNVFSMHVGNIMPGDSIIVSLTYTEMIVPEAGVYEFVYPTVVGPRYTNPPLTASTGNTPLPASGWEQNPYTSEGVAPSYSFDIKTCIRGGMPLSMVKVGSHETDINFLSQNKVEIKLKAGEAKSGNKDYIVQYRLAGDQIESGLLLYPGEDENFFLAMIQPPKRVVADDIPGREYIFIVDVSGSMYGHPLNTSKTLLRDLIGNLRPDDQFNVLLFAGGNSVMAPKSMAANQANIKRAVDLIDNLQGGGGTQLLPALKKAMAMPKSDGYSRSVVMVTDGYVSVEKEAMDIIRNNLGDANFFSFGIGSSVNRYIIEGMAHAGQGTPFILTSPNDAPAQADKFRQYIQSPVLTNIKVNYNGFEVYDIEPISIPDVLADRPIIIFGKYKGDAKGSISITGTSGAGAFKQDLPLSNATASADNKALMYLWAREKIKMMDDYNNMGFTAGVEEMTTSIGLQYNLLTAYTSFVAIDKEKRNDGTYEAVTQPLPLPEGVSNHATGGVVNSQSIHSMGNGAQLNSVVVISGNKHKSGNPSNTNTSYSKGRTRNYNAPVAAEDMTVVDVAEYESIDEPEPEHFVHEPVEANRVFVIVDVQPEFPGGNSALIAWIQNNLKYPDEAKKAGYEGKVMVQFVIDKQGNVIDVKIAKSSKIEALDKAALKLLKQMPLWKPGEKHGQVVKTKMVIPVSFKL